MTIAAVTPGPNNFIVMSAAARGGVAAALPAMTGVIGGSIALLVLIWAGAGTLFEIIPETQSMLRIAGGTYLVWLGFCLIRAANRPAQDSTDLALPETVWGVASFQLFNPKSWVLVITAVSAAGETLASMVSLMLIFVVVMGLCLTIWGIAGKLISNWLLDANSKRRFDTLMGLLLMGSAAMLLP
ncbi:MAG: LysE family translocator [Paracoccaceae bacterium]